MTSAEAGLPSIRAGEYFHCFTASMAAWRRNGGPLTASTLTTLPLASTLAFTTTLPWTFDCFANGGYTGCVEEINWGSRTVLAKGAAGLPEGGAG